MARKSREISGTGIYHVMMRGTNRQDIFEDSGESWGQALDSPSIHKAVSLRWGCFSLDAVIVLQSLLILLVLTILFTFGENSNTFGEKTNTFGVFRIRVHRRGTATWCCN